MRGCRPPRRNFLLGLLEYQRFSLCSFETSEIAHLTTHRYITEDALVEHRLGSSLGWTTPQLRKGNIFLCLPYPPTFSNFTLVLLVVKTIEFITRTRLLVVSSGVYLLVALSDLFVRSRSRSMCDFSAMLCVSV